MRIQKTKYISINVILKKGKQIMNNISILKIESDKGVVLISKNAKQEILPKSKIEIVRNINAEPMRQDQQKIKCIIETSDIPDVSMLKTNDKFKIYSIIKFKQYGTKTPQIEYVRDSLEVFDEYIIFRPIFTMLLTNFASVAKNEDSSPGKWRLEFEEA